jgi:hypothetical protein
MSVKIAKSQNSVINSAVDEIRATLGDTNPALVLFFASSTYEPGEISKAMKKVFSSSTVIGCSTAGEIISGHMLTNSVVAMALDADTISSVHAGIIPLESPANADTTLKSLSGAVGSTPIALDPAKYVGLILFDGLSGAEESTMERIGDLTNIQVIGGSAGDDLAFSKTFVYLDGNAYTNTAVFAILEPKKGFDIIKTQSFCSLGKKLTPTKVDTATRKVIEFDGKPAAVAYAEAVGVPLSEAASRFMKNPVGLMAGDEPFVRSPQRIEGDAVYFYCQVREGLELEVLSSTNIISDTRILLEEKNRTAPVEAVINFNCILRTLQLREEGKESEYGKIFSDIPTIGFSTYGEEYIGHINQTATMLLLLK